MPKPRLRIGDRSGRILTEMYADVGPISWRLNKIGQVKLTVSKKDSKLTRTNFTPGNRVIVDFPSDVGLPSWGGVIDLPFTWTPPALEVTCYSTPYLLKYRVDDRESFFPEVSVGTIVHSLLTEVEAEESIGLKMGNFAPGGQQYSKSYPLYVIWNIIVKELAKLEKFDLKFTPRVRSGRIETVVDLYAMDTYPYGTDLTGEVSLKEGRNVETARLIEQGPIVNDYYAAGGGKDWNTREIVNVYQSESQSKYGLRQGSKVYSGDTGPAALYEYATSVIEDQAEPRIRLELRVANRHPGRFGDYGVGDVARCVLPSYGFDGYEGDVQITTREYDPSTGSCKLVVREVSDMDVSRYSS